MRTEFYYALLMVGRKDRKREKKPAELYTQQIKLCQLTFCDASYLSTLDQRILCFQRLQRYFSCVRCTYIPKTIIVFHENTRMPQITSTARIPRIQ